MNDYGLGPAAAAELRQLIGEILADVLPGLARSCGAAPGPASAAVARPVTTAPGPVLGAGRVPSGIPAGAPSVPPSAPPSTRPAAPAQAGPRPLTARGVSRPGPAASDPPATPAPAPGESWTVSVGSDDELDAFVRRVLKLADNPKVRQDLITGRVRFKLAGRPAGLDAVPIHRVERGAVTERAVLEAARLGARLVVGKRAVLTPLARDKARALKVPIDKER